MSAADKGRDAADTLLDELQAMERWLTENGLRAVRAVIISDRRGAVTVQWGAMVGEEAADWRTFLVEAKALRAPFVATMVQRLTMDEWEGAKHLAVEAALTDAEQADVPASLEDSRSHIGQVGAIELKWLAPEYPGVVFAYNLFAPWFERFLGTDEMVGDGAQSRGGLSEQEVEELATTVARSADYEKAAEHGQREEVVRRLLPPKSTQDEHTLYRVMSAARRIFDTEVLPKLSKSPELIELAQKLASDQRFQRASNAQARRYAAEQVLPPEILEHETKLRVVLDRAKMVYDVDIRKGTRSSH